MEATGVSIERADRRAEQPIRAAELAGALSLATDLGTGQPGRVLVVVLGPSVAATSVSLGVVSRSGGAREDSG
jgi:hypothetical protein